MVSVSLVSEDFWALNTLMVSLFLLRPYVAVIHVPGPWKMALVGAPYTWVHVPK